MKKTGKRVVSILLAVAMMCMAGCGGEEKSEVQVAVDTAATMTYEELIEKAKEEVGDQVVKTYGNSSQLEKALAAFSEATGIKVENSKKSDTETYTELGEAFAAGKYTADMVLLQDGNKLQNEMLANGYLVNYIPMDQKENLAEDDLDPLAAVYLNKVFMYNNTDFDGNNLADAKQGALTNYMTNVWQVAGTDADEGHIANVSFKTPSNENVNMNFLVMLTSPEWVEKLEAAYKDFYGVEYVKEDAYENIGYKWIAEFLMNSQAHSSDGTACKDLAKGIGGSMALVNYNKQKSLESEGVGQQDKANITYPAIELGDDLQGFGGFEYKMYALVPANAKFPYAACAIINYITSADGFGAAWGAKNGYYSTNMTAAIAETDKELSWWKERLVTEDPEYVAANYRDVFQFVQQYEGK